MRRRSPEEARAEIAKPRTTKPRKPRAKPELTETTWPCDEEMAKAGFKVVRLDAKVKRHGVWVNAVTEDTPDRYYHNPRWGVSVFVEMKAPDGVLRPGQAQFIKDHEHNPTEAVCWSSLDDCKAWLEPRTMASRRGFYPWMKI